MFKLNLFYFYQRYKKSEGLRNISHNIGWLTLDKIFRLGVGLVVGLWIARYLGPKQYGIWNYAIALTSLFGSIATLGIDNILVRELVKYPAQRNILLGSAFFMRLFAGLLTTFLAVLTIYFINKGDRLLIYLATLNSLTFIFQAIYIIDNYFQSQIKSKYSVYAHNAAFIVISIVKIGLIILNYPLIAFAIAGAIEVTLISIFLIYAYSLNQMSIRSWLFKYEIAKLLIKDSWPQLLAGLSILVYMRIDLVMIGNMLGNKEVGIYSAAVKISEIWFFIPLSIVNTLFPIIIKSKNISDKIYYSRIQKLLVLMAWLSIVIAILMSFMSGFVINLLFGKEYIQASSILIIHIWSGVPVCLGLASGAWFTAENLQIIHFYRTIIGAIVNVILNMLLIPKFGASGAALATVVSYFISVFSAILFRRARTISIMMLKSFILDIKL